MVQVVWNFADCPPAKPSRDVVSMRRFDAVAASILHRLDRMESAAATFDYVLHKILSERLSALGRTLGIQDAAV